MGKYGPKKTPYLGTFHTVYMIEFRHLFRFNQIYMFIRSRECKTVPLEMTNLAFFEKLLTCQVSAYNLS